MADQPNIILVLVDDMGYSDIGCYGGEIYTPTLDRLAESGVRFTQFYNCARCCPTRASLLTGLYPHQAGIGHMTSENEWTLKFNQSIDDEAYQGFLNERCATVAEILRNAGYATYMSGKWHVGSGQRNRPMNRGFDRYFGILSGACNYFKPQPDRMLLEGNSRVEPWEGFYTTDAFSDYAVRCIDEHEDSRPFFLYLAYTAPHWPLHAWPEDIERYRGKYMIGWDELRARRFQRQKELGLFPCNTRLSLRDEESMPWDTVDNRQDWDLRMAVYAAMVDRIDQGLSKVVEALEKKGQLDTTLILFMSDNGACAETFNSVPDVPPGPENSGTGVWLPWANASNTPFRLFKHWIHEGGIATPLVVHWPAAIPSARIESRYAAHVKDIMATLLEAANTGYPSEYNGHPIIPSESTSFLPLLLGASRENPETMYWEHEGNRAVRRGRWKLASYYSEAHGFTRKGVGRGCRTGPWELYDMHDDPTELNNLVASRSELAGELISAYERYAERTGVLDWQEVQKIRGTCKS